MGALRIMYDHRVTQNSQHQIHRLHRKVAANADTHPSAVMGLLHEEAEGEGGGHEGGVGSLSDGGRGFGQKLSEGHACGKLLGHAVLRHPRGQDLTQKHIDLLADGHDEGDEGAALEIFG